MVVPDRIKKEHVPPGSGYIEAVDEGYGYHGITISNLIFKKAHLWAKTQLLASAKGKVTKSAVNHLFIYGTLRGGEAVSYTHLTLPTILLV